MTLAAVSVIGIAIGLIGGVLLARGRQTVALTADANHTRPNSADRVPHDLPGSLVEAIDHLATGIVIASDTGSVIYSNRRWSLLAGTHAGLLVDEELTKALTDARHGQRSSRLVELHGPPKLWLSITSEHVPDGMAVAMIEDVSERMRTDAMRSDFVANISHELKTPVGAIAVLAEALADEQDPEVVSRLARHLVDESHRAVSTIDDLLKLSQIESSGPGSAVVDLTALVEGVVHTATHRAEISAGGPTVEIDGEPGPIMVRGDERQLQSALGNLVENALKYSQDDNPVHVSTRIAEDSVEVAVVDQGVGIPESDIDRIFERFYRVDKARSRDTGGTGLGLAIARNVAANHGGDVQVSSREGEGSTFVFRIPVLLVTDQVLKDD